MAFTVSLRVTFGIAVPYLHVIALSDAGYGEWGSWSECTKTCANRNDAIRRKSKYCNNPDAKYGGNPCQYYEISSTEDCDLQSCPFGEQLKIK